MSNTAPLFAIGDEVVFNQCGKDFKAVVRGASVNGSVLVQLKDNSHRGHSGIVCRHPKAPQLMVRTPTGTWARMSYAMLKVE